MKVLKRIVIVTIIILAIQTTNSFAKTGKVIVSASRLREEPNTNSEIVTMVYEDDEVEILGEEKDWYKIKVKTNTGYVKKDFIKVTNNEESSSSSENNQELEGDIITIETTTMLKTLPSFMSKNITSLDKGRQLKKVVELNKWIQITDGTITGWILKNKTNTNNTNIIMEPVKDENSDTSTTNTAITNSVSNTTNTTNTTNITNTTNTTNTTASGNTLKNEATNNVIEETNNTQTINKNGKINVETARVREKASSEAEIIDGLDYGAIVNILGEEGDWYKVKSGNIEGYVNKRLITISDNTNTTSRSIQEPRENEEKVVTTNNVSSSNGQAVVNFAKQYLGYPYVSAGKTPETGFDCSGFTRYVFLNFGYTLGGSAESQSGVGREVSRSELNAGDLLLFYDEGKTKIGHTGIYIGNGDFIHAANPKRGVVIDNLNSNSYYNTRFITARRIVE